MEERKRPGHRIHNKTSEEEKYLDLLESLKKNNTIKEYVNRTLIEKVGNDRTVKKILDVLAEKYSKTKGEQMLDLMRMISVLRAEMIR